MPAIIEKATYPEIRRLAAFNSASAYVFEGDHANAAAAFTALLAEPQLPLAMRAEASFALAGGTQEGRGARKRPSGARTAFRNGAHERRPRSVRRPESRRRRPQKTP